MADKVTICSGCQTTGRPAKGAEMADRLAVLLSGTGIVVATTDCMIVCGQPVTVSVRSTGKAAYLFSAVDPDTQVEEVATFARLYAATSDGIVDDVRPCGDLRFRLIGRLPA
jgi:predicted metal-binding protein